MEKCRIFFQEAESTMKPARFGTRFGLSDARKSIKMKVDIFKSKLFLFRRYLQKSEMFKI